MTESNCKLAVVLEVEQGETTLRAARLLREAGLHNDALSRLYYAVFHFAAALLLTEGIEPRTHRAIAGLLGQSFVRMGVLTAGDVAAVSRAYGHRDLADYERTWKADAAVTDSAFVEAEALITKIRALIEAGGWLSP